MESPECLDIPGFTIVEYSGLYYCRERYIIILSGTVLCLFIFCRESCNSTAFADIDSIGVKD